MQSTTLGKQNCTLFCSTLMTKFKTSSDLNAYKTLIIRILKM